MDIEELLNSIDSLDRQLLELLAQRFELALEINRHKQRLRLPLRDTGREVKILDAARASAANPLYAAEAEQFMQQLLAFSRQAVRRRMAAHDVKPQRIAIVGLGLIGGSVARALKRATPGHTLSGIDLPGRLDTPRESNLFEQLVTPEQGAGAVKDADVVFLCAPPSRNLELLPTVMRDAPINAIVTDVGGVKRKICEVARTSFEPPGPLFVGGHPMAGKSLSGFEHSTASLFEARPWILTPERHTPVSKLRALWRLLESTGAAVQIISADEHDRIMPALSHLPQLGAVALTLTIGGRDRGLAGPALQDMTRLAESSAELWQELLSASREECVGELQRLRTYLTELEVALGLGEPVSGHFQRAAKMRAELMRAAVTNHETGE